MTHHPIIHIRFLENRDNLENETYVKGDMAFKVQYRMKETTGKVRKYMKWGNVKEFILQIENLHLFIVWWFRTEWWAYLQHRTWYFYWMEQQTIEAVYLEAHHFPPQSRSHFVCQRWQKNFRCGCNKVKRIDTSSKHSHIWKLNLSSFNNWILALDTF